MTITKNVNVALIGQSFMGKAHSNAWNQVGKFFDAPLSITLHTICGRDTAKLQGFAANWGWHNVSADWKKVCRSSEIDLVDIATPNYLHAPMAIEAIRCGKHVACEKPLAGTLEDARKITSVASKANVKTFVWFNYRRCPAVALAHNLVRSGRIGQIRRVHASYLQEWADESIPLSWRFLKKQAGSGAHGDLNAHIVDMVRFVTGQEVIQVCGALAETFISNRHKMVGSTGDGITEGLERDKGRVTVDDTVLFLARFSGGAVGSFEAARQASGNYNRNSFEINGTKGAIRFDFERMNELQYLDTTADRAVQGWTTIMCTHAGDHPYVDAWWPDGHIIGYEHTFTNMAYDILAVLAGKKPIVPLPDFEDAYETQRVLEAVLISAKEKRSVDLSQSK